MLLGAKAAVLHLQKLAAGLRASLGSATLTGVHSKKRRKSLSRRMVISPGFSNLQSPIKRKSQNGNVFQI